MPTQCQTSGLQCRVSFLGRLEMISKDVSASLHEDIAISLLHSHIPPRNGLLPGLHSTSSEHPQHSKQTFNARCLTQPDPCPCSQGRQEVKTREKSESRSLLLTDAKCSLSANFREPKIASVLFRNSASKAARHTLGKTQLYQLSKATEISHCLHRDDTKHMCTDLSVSLLLLFVADALCSLPDNSCCRRGRLGRLSCAHYEIIQVGALSSALKFL